MVKLNRKRLIAMGWLGLAVGSLSTACSGTSASGPEIGVGGNTAGGAMGTGGGAVGGSTVSFGGTGVAGSSSGVITGGNHSTGGASNATAGGSQATGGNKSTGGALSAGGSGTNGGASSTGGTNAAGGATTAGGSIATGGSRATGGSTNTGGSNSMGGTSTTGGSKATGGAVPTGGTRATGGSSVTGGTSSTGGSTSTGSAALRIVGRTNPGTTGITTSPVTFSWPGVNIHAQFTGTQVSMDLTGGGTRFTVVVDGSTPKTVTGITGSLSLFSGLTNGTHDLVIWRNTEASPGGITSFTGVSNFGTGGALLAPAAAPNKRIEVIGDSLSVGAGVEGNATCAGGIDAYTNNYLAYGSVAARTVGADVVTIAWSGIGVYRNYDGSTTNTMPQRYPYSVPTNTTLWDFTLYQPHVTVINLGTNDFGAGDPGTAYETAYVSFIKTVRSKYASTYFILIDMYGGERLTRINDVIATLKAGGEPNVEVLGVSSVQNNLGCNQHPNVAGQAAMGGVLATRLKSLMGW